ncbi:MAG: prepilin-type N-terminal cleavage/methylation domain-containing protein, partial [candidate division WOR-3 bacterium]
MRKKGYTLVEVLIASLIFSAMVVLASFAFNQGMRQYEAVARRGINFWENTKILLLERSISSMLDYYVVDEKNFWFPY